MLNLSRCVCRRPYGHELRERRFSSKRSFQLQSFDLSAGFLLSKKCDTQYLRAI